MIEFDTFLQVWNGLSAYNYKYKKAHEYLNIDLGPSSKDLYDATILLLRVHFTEAQVDMIVWSIFDDEPILQTNAGNVSINDPYICWEYINKLSEHGKENQSFTEEENFTEESGKESSDE